MNKLNSPPLPPDPVTSPAALDARAQRRARIRATLALPDPSPKLPAGRPGAKAGVPRPFRPPANPTAWRAARLALGITQNELAARIGVSGSRIRAFEAGVAIPRLAYQIAINSLSRAKSEG